jgi:signal transduction histidine kinase
MFSMSARTFLTIWWMLFAIFAVSLFSRASAATPAIHIEAAEISALSPGSYADPPLQLDPRKLPLAWSPVALPHVVAYNPRTGVHSDILSVWYRVRPANPVGVRDAYLYIPRWEATGKIAIYADGRLIYAPRSSAVWNGFNQPVWTPLAKLGEPMPKEILIHINQVAGAGSALSSVWVGDDQSLAPRMALRRAVQIEAPKFACEILMVTGAVTIIIWFRRRSESVYLLIFALGALNYIHGLEYSVGLYPLPISDGWFQWLESNSEVWWITLTLFLTVQYGGGGFFRSRLLIGALAALFTIITLLIRADIGFLKAALPLMWTAVLVATAVATVIAWLSYARAPSREGLLFSSFMTLILPAGVHDIAMSRFIIGPEHIFWVPWLSVLQTILVLYVILYRYLRALDLAQRSESELALRLARREHELSDTYLKLRESQQREVLIAERQRLMRDMHDGVGSLLIGALSAVEGGRASAPDTALILRECIDDLKLTIDSLEPVESDLLLLLATVRYRLQPRFEKAGVKLNWQVDDVPTLPSLQPDQALHILRMAQEIFTNVLKHAKASAITVSVKAESRTLIIAFEDDGVGFQPHAERPSVVSRRGLLNLKARAAAIGGEIAWSSNPGKTRFELRLPLEPDEPPKDGP